eukprot:750711-Rhodomonas_salina.2
MLSRLRSASLSLCAALVFYPARLLLSSSPPLLLASSPPRLLLLSSPPRLLASSPPRLLLCARCAHVRMTAPHERVFRTPVTRA